MFLKQILYVRTTGILKHSTAYQWMCLKVAYVLDTMNIEYKILSNTEADIFEKVNISKLTTELSKKDCEVISIHEHDESLESYFVSLVGGARHE